jgi:hypothetical protein
MIHSSKEAVFGQILTQAEGDLKKIKKYFTRNSLI